MNNVKKIIQKKYSFWDSIFPISLSIFLIIFVVWVIIVSLHSNPLHSPTDTQTTTNNSSLKGGDNS